MAHISVNNVEIKGVTVCVPPKIVENKNYTAIPEESREQFIKSIGIERRRIVDDNVCTSDLCYKAAENLIEKLNWNKNDIDLLIFVSQTPDYKMPATSCILQDRLKLTKSCMAFDISQGCTGYVYGLSVAANLVASGNLTKALLLVGNTQSKNTNYHDQSTYPLFGDAGSATALEYSPDSNTSFKFGFTTDGSGANSIIIPDGGYRNPITNKSFELENFEGGIKRTRLNLRMEGEDVFSFVISQVPKTTQVFFENFHIDQDEIDFFLLHHASQFLCNKLQKKMKFPIEKVPYILKDFGNSSNASIPLLMVTELKKNIISNQLNLFISGFGVGLSIGVALITVNKLQCSDLIIY